MSPLPVGTLTLLFSDIEGSTSLLTGLGAGWADALSTHRAIMRDAFRAHGGIEMGTEGDSFFVVFTSATQALQAAVAAQRGLAEHEWQGPRELRVRIGLHTGEPQLLDDDYVGIDLHLGARIAATAHGGQIVISETTHALVGEALRGLVVRDLGWHRLKDFPEPQHLYDVSAPELPSEHAPLRSLGVAASLPAYATAMVGRQRELDEVTDAIARVGARLVTITGPGGTGKTRLAVATANELRERTGREVFFVPLSSADRTPLMWAHIAEQVGAPANADQLPVDRALGFLRDRAGLLVLDNVEQIDGADTVVAQLLNEAPQVALLVTSRRPLHLVGEQLYPLATLALPEQQIDDPDVVARTAAVQLFVQRARMVKPGFALTSDNVSDVVTLCRRLDGLPLAIELAAARSRLLGPRALLSHIDSWFDQAIVGSDRPERHQTLTRTISWSYDMLAPEDQRVFRLLAVFTSRVGLDAVQEVVGADGRDPLDIIAHLADVSLLEVVEGADGEPMIYMLQTIRRFARELLDASGEAESTQLRHAGWCLRVATEIAALLSGPRQMSARDRMDGVMEDIRSALDWTLVPSDQAAPERLAGGLALLAPMDPYWYRFGYIQEGRGWHRRALAAIDRHGGGDSVGIVDALHGHGVLAIQQGDLETAVQALDRALEMAQRLGDLPREVRESNSLGIAQRERGEAETARALVARSLEIARRIGDAGREATALGNTVVVLIDSGEYAAAVEAAHLALAADEALEDAWGVAIDRSNLVLALLCSEGPAAAFRELVEVAPRAVGLGDVDLAIDVIDRFAAVWGAFGGGERAATMLGAADRQRELGGLPRKGPDRQLLERFIEPVRRATDPAIWDGAYARGRGLTVDAAVAEGSIADHDLQPVLRTS